MIGHPEDWYGIIDELKQLKEGRKAIEYFLASAESEIDEKLIMGWELYGPPFPIVNEGFSLGFAQAMVK